MFTMKRRIIPLVLLTFIFLNACGFAGTAQRFKSGFKDVLLSPLQISNNVKTETANAKFLPFALAGGLLKGSFYMAKQMVKGVVGVVTSPLEKLHQ